MNIKCKHCRGYHIVDGRKSSYSCSKVLGGEVLIKKKQRATKIQKAMIEILRLSEPYFNDRTFVQITDIAKSALKPSPI